MRLKDQYDWVVLGDHPGSLLSAGLLCNLGYSVLVLPSTPSLLAGITDSGHFLDPEPNFQVGLGYSDRQPGLLAECIQHLGVSSAGKQWKFGEDLFPQIVTPEARFQLTRSNEEFLAEMDRELGTGTVKGIGLSSALHVAESKLLSYWREFPARQFGKSSKRSRSGLLMQELRRDLSRFGRSASGHSKMWFQNGKRISDLATASTTRGVQEVCGGLWYGVTHLDAENPLLVDWLHAVVLSRTGAGFRGGMTAFRKFLLEIAKKRGAQVPDEIECRRVFVENGKLIGVQVSHRGTMVSVSGGILGCSLAHAREHLYVSGKKRKLNLKAHPQPFGWRFTLSLLLHAEALPPGISNRAIWKERSGPVLEVEVADPEDYGLGKTGNRAVFLRTWIPFTQDTLNIGYQRMIAARMFRQLTELFPFLEYHVVKIYPDFREDLPVNGPDQFSRAYGFVTPELVPENLRCIDGDGVGHLSGVENLYVASGESYPFLGSFGGTVAAIQAVTEFVGREMGASSGTHGQKGLWSFID